jgi:hypothetical protein
VSSLLVSTLNAAALLLASAVSGIAIALHLAAAPQTSEHHPLRGAAATPPAIAAAPMDEPKIVTAELPATGQARDEAAPAVVSDASANKLAPWVSTRAAPSGAERELTFAWGYAQRHPEALARTVEPQVIPTLAGGRTQEAERLSKREPRRPPQRHRASTVHRDTVGVATSGFFADVDRESHQAPSYTEPRNPNGARAFRRAQSSPSARHRSVSLLPHA